MYIIYILHLTYFKYMEKKMVHLNLTARTLDMVKQFQEANGISTTTAAIAIMISNAYIKQFPAYIAKKVEKEKEKELTEEEYCISKGGTIDKEKGLCVLPMGDFGHMTRKVPLGIVKQRV